MTNIYGEKVEVVTGHINMVLYITEKKTIVIVHIGINDNRKCSQPILEAKSRLLVIDLISRMPV